LEDIVGEVIYLRGDAPCDTEESVVIDLDVLARSARMIAARLPLVDRLVILTLLDCLGA
jgi:hypothetical protein